MLAKELVHSMRRKQGKGGWLAVKIDLEKSYDRINWSFLEKVLEIVGLEPNLINLIMFCVTTPSISLIWNGEILNLIKPGRGLR